MGFESDMDVNLKKNRDSERYLGTHQFSSECRKKTNKETIDYLGCGSIRKYDGLSE